MCLEILLPLLIVVSKNSSPSTLNTVYRLRRLVLRINIKFVRAAKTRARGNGNFQGRCILLLRKGETFTICGW